MWRFNKRNNSVWVLMVSAQWSLYSSEDWGWVACQHQRSKLVLVFFSPGLARLDSRHYNATEVGRLFCILVKTHKTFNPKQQHIHSFTLKKPMLHFALTKVVWIDAPPQAARLLFTPQSGTAIEQSLMCGMTREGGLTRGRCLTDSVLDKWNAGARTRTCIGLSLGTFAGTHFISGEQHVNFRPSCIRSPGVLAVH